MSASSNAVIYEPTLLPFMRHKSYKHPWGRGQWARFWQSCPTCFFFNLDTVYTAFESAAQLLILSSSLSKMWAWPSLRWTWKSLHNFIDLPGVYRCLRSFYSFRTWLISLILSKCTKSIAPPVAASGNELGRSDSLNIFESLAPSVTSLSWTSYCMHLTCLTKHW